MTTAHDLTIVSLEVPSDHPVERGDLSLALAGAELIDLLEAGAVVLDGLRPRPGSPTPSEDALLDAAASLAVQEPAESVEDWLWRRGDGLAARYLAAAGADDGGGRRRPRWNARRTAGRQAPVPADAPARRRAGDRWSGGDPVLVALAAAVGIRHEAADQVADPEDEGIDDGIAVVLAAVNDAVVELAAIRQRRSIEEAAFDNIWRGL
ncbi:GPP34 family phosphoprotein [Streptomyces sp. NPDC093065]|uniref:GPP34 family phosphoprotein n=1 Tax=Streptomyces sp. NPDC093065 TaxID=3366021 RepID=UPI0037FA3077